jgi:hypothetical protein
MKILYTLLLIFTIQNLAAQSYPGKDVQLFIGKTVKPIEKMEALQKIGYNEFYSVFDTVKRKLSNPYTAPRAYQVGSEYNPKTDYKKLAGVPFKVIDTFHVLSQNSWEKDKFYMLQLVNDSLGTIYYQYSVDRESALELEVVGGLTFPEGYFCQKIDVIEDKFEKTTNYHSPDISGVGFMKVIQGGKPYLYMNISVVGYSLSVDGKGVTILLSNGEKIVRAAQKIDVNVGSGSGYDYSAFITLTTADITKLSNNTITDIRLYVYDSEIDHNDAVLIREYLKCMKK